MINLLLDIVTTAALLFIVSAGLLAIFGVLKIINFAHGAWLTIGGYCVVVTTHLGQSPWLALPLAFCVAALLGGFAELIVIRPLYRRPLDAILATWGLSIVIGQVITLTFGRDIQMTNQMLSGTSHLAGIDYSSFRLLGVLIALAIGLSLHLLLERTRLGLNARAVIMNEPLARTLGVNTSKVRLLVFMIGTGLAGLAGCLLAPLSSVDPNMGVGWLTGAFMLVMLAGSSFGTLGVACIVLGAAQVLVSTFYSPILGGITIACLSAIALRLRPQGFANA